MPSHRTGTPPCAHFSSSSRCRQNHLFSDSYSTTEVLTPIDQQECKTYDFDGDETKTGSARMVVYVGAM